LRFGVLMSYRLPIKAVISYLGVHVEVPSILQEDVMIPYDVTQMQNETQLLRHTEVPPDAVFGVMQPYEPPIEEVTLDHPQRDSHLILSYELYQMSESQSPLMQQDSDDELLANVKSLVDQSHSDTGAFVTLTTTTCIGGMTSPR
jgi:hypothetical protein